MESHNELTEAQWKIMVKLSTNLELLYDRIKRRMSPEDRLYFEDKLRYIEYGLWYNSPHTRGKTKMKEAVYEECLKDYAEFNKRFR